MTISTTTILNSFSGNGSTTAFTYTFPINTTGEISVIERSATGVETVKTEGTGSTNYGIADTGASGGIVTMVTAPASGTTLVIRRNTEFTQETDYVANDPFPAETHEDALDKLQMQNQELEEELNRSIKISRTNTMTSTEFTTSAADRANKILSFNAAGELAVAQELGTFKGNSATTTTAAFVVRDIVKGTTTAQLNNIYICIQASPVGTALTNTSFWVVIVDAVSAAASATTATTKATAAASSATAAAASETAAETAETNAETAETNAAASFDSFDDRYLGAKSSNPSTDNDSNALITGALYFNTSTSQIFNWTAADAWEAIKPTSTQQTAINALAASAVIADMAILGTTDVVNDMNILATNDVVSDMNVLATSDVVTDMNVLGTADVVNDMNVLGSSATVTAMNLLGTSAVVTDMGILGTADVVTDMNVLATSDVVADMNTLGTAAIVGNMNLLGTSTVVGNMATVVSNLSSVNNFGEVYRIASSAPSSSLNSGDLYFNTSTNVLNVYGASGWQNAGSSVNGTSNRFKFVASGTPTSFSGNDANGKSLSYDAGFIDVYLNGIKMVNGTDVTVTSGSAIVFASAVTNGDIIEAVAFGTFAVANLNASNLSSGTVPTARLSGAYTGITSLGTITSFRSTGIDDNSNALAMTIDSSENVLVGVTSTSEPGIGNTTAGLSLRNSGSIASSRDGDTAGYFNRNTNDGSIISIRKAGTEVGSLETVAVSSSGRLIVKSKTFDGFLDRAGTTIAKWMSASFTPGADNTFDLGRSSERWKDIYLSGGAFIGGTGTANKLDDYEEGTFTPNDQSGASLNFNPQGQYTKVGSIVHFSVNINVPSTSSSAGIIIGGLPFTVGDAQSTDYYGGYVTGTNTNVAFLLLCSRNSTRIAPRTLTNGEIANSAFSGKFFNFSGYYSIL